MDEEVNAVGHPPHNYLKGDNMKNFGKSGSFTLWIVFVGIGFSMATVASTITEYRLLERISEDYYSSNAIAFVLENIDNESQHVLFNGLEEGVILYKPLGDEIRGVYFKGHVPTFPLVRGRFFNEQDFDSGDRVAVIGQALQDQVVEINGVEMYSFSGQLFRIIGILGIHMPTKLDRMVLLNMNSLLSFQPIGPWRLDGEREVRRSYERLQHAITSEGYSIREVNTSTHGVGRLFHNQNAFQYIYVILLFNLLSCGTVVTYFWVQQRRAIIAIQQLCGYRRSYIFVDAFRLYLLLSTTGYGVGFLTACFLAGFSRLTIDSLPLFMMISLMVFPICALILLIFMNRWTDQTLRSV